MPKVHYAQQRFFVAGVIILAGIVTAFAWPAPLKGAPPAASAPSSAPAAAALPPEKTVLVRFGDKAVITQADFEAAVIDLPAEEFTRAKNRVMGKLAEDVIQDLYLEDHPGLVTDKDIDTYIQGTMKKLKMKSLDELVQRLQERSGTSFEEYRLRVRRRILIDKVVSQALAPTGDEKALQAIFAANPDHFNGTMVSARQILLRKYVYETPDQLRAKRERLAKMREELVSGQRTWESCLAESDWKVNNGNMGSFKRHSGVEPVAAAAFALKPGETSPVIESPYGFHLIQVMYEKPGDIPFTDPHVSALITSYLHKNALWKLRVEVLGRYPLVGVQPPQMPEYMRAALATRPATSTQPTATRPARARQNRTTPPAPATRPAK